MKPIWILLVALLGVVCVAAAAHADSSSITLLGNGRAEYRFDYAGDRTPIEIALDSPGAQYIQFSVYLANSDGTKPSPDASPVGRGTPSRNHGLYWSGGFNIPGTIYVAVENHSAGAQTYTLGIVGASVRGVALLVADTPHPDASWATPHVLNVELPPGAGPSSLKLNVPGAPAACTHAKEVPSIVSTSLKLCPNETYSPIHLVGNNIALYTDDAHSAVVASQGRQFAVTVEGFGDFVEGITIQASADPGDAGAWLCQYDECVFPPNPAVTNAGGKPVNTTLNGGIVYGGGILLRGAYTTIHAVTVRGGTIGIATVDGVGNNIVDSDLSELNGWGIFNLRTQGGYFVGNKLDNDNHGCTTPDGRKFKHGCETAGWTCLACRGNVIARNHCASSGNCFYMSGERGLASNDNRLIENYCAGATDNCFEITFSRGNVLKGNLTTADPISGEACKYPYWIGGSSVVMTNNVWQCDISPDDALAQATSSTEVATEVINFDGPIRASTSPAQSASVTITPAESTAEHIPRGIVQ